MLADTMVSIVAMDGSDRAHRVVPVRESGTKLLRPDRLIELPADMSRANPVIPNSRINLDVDYSDNQAPEVSETSLREKKSCPWG